MMGSVVIWSKPNCPYCSRSKHILSINNIPFTEKVLGKDFTREILKEAYPSAMSYPVIVVDGFYIGGYTQLAEKLSQQLNTTQQLLNE